MADCARKKEDLCFPLCRDEVHVPQRSIIDRERLLHEGSTNQIIGMTTGCPYCDLHLFKGLKYSNVVVATNKQVMNLLRQMRLK